MATGQVVTDTMYRRFAAPTTRSTSRTPLWSARSARSPLIKRTVMLDVQLLLCIGNDFVAHVAVPLQPAPIHSREHQDVPINVVVDLNDSLGIVKPMKSPDVLLKRALPRNRH